MTEQIVVFETSNALSPDKYMVCKVSFSNSDSNKGEYDMLIYDKAANSYFAFEIKHTTEPNSKQYNHLLNEDFKKVTDYYYGNKENVAVLYNGKPFNTPRGVMYLNISDYIKEITHSKDAKSALEKLSKDLPIRDLETEEKASATQGERTVLTKDALSSQEQGVIKP